MIPLALVCLPLLGALLLLLPAARARAERILATVALAVAGLAAWSAVRGEDLLAWQGWFCADATARLFLAVIDPIFAGIALHSWHRVASDPELRPGMARHVALSLPFLAACNAVVLAAQLEVAWLALELSTLVAAPLVARTGTPVARRASWQYLLFSLAGLGLVAAGFVGLDRGLAAAGHDPELLLQPLRAGLAAGATPWTALGIAAVLIGLCTKLGLAPMYTWLPTTYDEAPTSVAAMLGAVQFNAAFVLLLRVVEVGRPAHGELITVVLVTVGLLSMVVATASLVATRNLKRLLAYASVQHGGVLAIGVGVGGPAAYGVLLYAASNAFIKAILFLTAGQIHRHCQTKDTGAIRDLIKALPYSGLLLMLGTFALLGFPPFGSFFGELLILSALVETQRMAVFGGFCALLAVAFVATGRTVFPMIWGSAGPGERALGQPIWGALPKLMFVGVLVALGVWMPATIDALLQQAAGGIR